MSLDDTLSTHLGAPSMAGISAAPPNGWVRLRAATAPAPGGRRETTPDLRVHGLVAASGHNADHAPQSDSGGARHSVHGAMGDRRRDGARAAQ